jgi:hypothetical protein
MTKNSNDEGRFLISCWDVLLLITTTGISFKLPLKRVLLKITELKARIVQFLSLPKLIAFIVGKNPLCLAIGNACRIYEWKAIIVSKGHITAYMVFCCSAELKNYFIFNINCIKINSLFRDKHTSLVTVRHYINSIQTVLWRLKHNCIHVARVLCTKRRGRVWLALLLHIRESHGFKFRPGNRLSWLTREWSGLSSRNLTWNFECLQSLSSNLYVSILFASLTMKFYFNAVFVNQLNTFLLLFTI